MEAQDPGYYMLCFLGQHEYENGHCKHCSHREVMID